MSKAQTKIEYIPNGDIKITTAGGNGTIISRSQHLQLLRLLLTRQDSHTIAKTSPFVLVVRAEFEMDREQTTPHRTFVMPCRTRQELSLLADHLGAEIATFMCWKIFSIDKPVLPEKDFYPEDLVPAAGNPLHYYVPRFFAELCEHDEHFIAVGYKRWNEFALAEWRQMYAVAKDKQSVAERYEELGGVMPLDLTEKPRKKKR